MMTGLPYFLRLIIPDLDPLHRARRRGRRCLSVGSRADSFDNALAESVIGLYKTELNRNKGPWRGLDDVEFGTLEWVDWWNNRRLLEPIGRIPPAEAEAAYYSEECPVAETATQETESL